MERINTYQDVSIQKIDGKMNNAVNRKEQILQKNTGKRAIRVVSFNDILPAELKIAIEEVVKSYLDEAHKDKCHYRIQNGYVVVIPDESVAADLLLTKFLNHYNITIEQLKPKSRRHDALTLRNEWCFIMKLTRFKSCVDTGKLFDIDHATVLNSYKDILKKVSTNRIYRKYMEVLFEKFGLMTLKDYGIPPLVLQIAYLANPPRVKHIFDYVEYVKAYEDGKLIKIRAINNYDKELMPENSINLIK